MTWMLLIVSLMQPTWSEEIEKPPASDELDLRTIEEHYWSAKDQDYDVVQNRRFEKEGRVAIALTHGNMLNDSNSTGTSSELNLLYYFNETYAIELSYNDFNLKDNDATVFFRDRFEVTPDHNKMENSTSVGLNWTPIYAKMNLLQKKIIHFDMSVTAYVGQSAYTQQISEGNETLSAFHYGININQLFFFHPQMAIRFVMKNQWSDQERYKYEEPSNNTSRELGSDTLQISTLQFGLIYFH